MQHSDGMAEKDPPPRRWDTASELAARAGELANPCGLYHRLDDSFPLPHTLLDDDQGGPAAHSSTATTQQHSLTSSACGKGTAFGTAKQPCNNPVAGNKQTASRQIDGTRGGVHNLARVSQDADTSGMILPTEAWKERWDLFVMCLIIYSAVTVPIRVCFESDAEGLVWKFEASMSLFFLIDMAFCFRTAYADDGVWVTDPILIRKRYLAGWFWIDAPSSLPVEFITLVLTMLDPAGDDSTLLAGLRALRMFRLFRLLRLLKIDEYIKQAEEALNINLRALRLVCAPIIFSPPRHHLIMPTLTLYPLMRLALHCC